MAHTKSGGSTKLGRDSEAKRLGIKLFDGMIARPGMVIVRQRGTKFLPGKGVKRGGDDTLYAIKSGIVKFKERTKVRFDGRRRKVSVVEIE
jgi:large subunit ribosomal protein L27